MLVGILAPNSVGMMGRVNELLCKGQKQRDELPQAVNDGEKREHWGIPSWWACVPLASAPQWMWS